MSLICTLISTRSRGFSDEASFEGSKERNRRTRRWWRSKAESEARSRHKIIKVRLQAIEDGTAGEEAEFEDVEALKSESAEIQASGHDGQSCERYYGEENGTSTISAKSRTNAR